MRLLVICTVLILTLIVLSLCAGANFHGNDKCTEDSIDVSGKSYKILVNPDADNVTKFWDDKTNEWANVSSCPVDLNKAYAQNQRFKEMQDELNVMKDERWNEPSME